MMLLLWLIVCTMMLSMARIAHQLLMSSVHVG